MKTYGLTGLVILLFALVFLLSASIVPGYGDIITFDSGDELHGEVIQETEDSISIRLITGGTMKISRNMIDKVVNEPEEVYYIRRGDLFFSHGEYNRALQEYARAEEIAPGLRTVQEKIRRIRTKQSRDVCEVMMREADEFLAQGDYRTAVNHLVKASNVCEEGEMLQEIRTKLAQAQSELAHHYFNHCFVALALDELTKAEEYDPYCAHIYYVLGRIYHSQSRFQTAYREYRRALDLQPDMRHAQEYLLKLEKDIERTQGSAFRGA